MLTDVRADTTTLTVKVQNSTTDTTTTTYTNNVYNTTSMIVQVFLQEVEGGNLKFILEMVQQVKPVRWKYCIVM